MMVTNEVLNIFCRKCGKPMDVSLEGDGYNPTNGNPCFKVLLTCTCKESARYANRVAVKTYCGTNVTSEDDALKCKAYIQERQSKILEAKVQAGKEDK